MDKECPYGCHEEMKEDIKLCLVARVQVLDMKEQVSALFEYRDSVVSSIQAMKEELINLRHAQHTWAAMLTSIKSDVENLCAGYAATKAEVEKFAWFRDPLNRWQKKLPFFVIGVVMLALVSFILPFELMGKALDLIKKVSGWFK